MPDLVFKGISMVSSQHMETLSKFLLERRTEEPMNLSEDLTGE